MILSSCSKTSNGSKTPDFDTQLVELDNSKFEIPKSWEKITAPSSMKQTIFAPIGADLSAGTSNVSFIITKASTNADSLEDLKTNSSTFEEQIKSIFPKATDFKFNNFKSNAGDVFTIEYKIPYGNTTLQQTQYYLLMEHYVVVITATDINDNVSPNVNDVAKHMIHSFKLNVQ